MPNDPSKVLNEDPLFSIIVITYNSEKYIIQTLESAKYQTYDNIELIISDDGSSDNTVEICRNWLEANKKQFKRTELVTIDKNTGIPANCNRGLALAKGEWVKFIAGDDCFEPLALSHVAEFVKKNEGVRNLDSKVRVFNHDLSKLESHLNGTKAPFFYDETSSSEQLKLLANNLNNKRLISTLGVFLKRDLILEIGGFDEEYLLLEDTPLWIKILRSGNRFHFLDEFTVIYRRHDESVSFNDKSKITKVLSDFEITLDRFCWNYLFADLTLINKLNAIWLRIVYNLVQKAGNKGWLARTILKTGLIFQPLRLLWFKRKSRVFYDLFRRMRNKREIRQTYSYPGRFTKG
jgi:alpha-1,3-rhamnosyltransferase